ncbi:regulatory protein RecX [Nitrospira sp. Kam-Ns4a]
MAKTLAGAVTDPAERLGLGYLAGRDRTEAQVSAYLARRGVPASRIARLLTRWRALGYLDDERYALRWGAARLARRPVGRSRLAAELLSQGLDQAIVERTLDQLYVGAAERVLAEALLAKRRDVSPSGAAALLRRHGFDEDVIAGLLGAAEADAAAEEPRRLPRAGRHPRRPGRSGARQEQA